MSVVWNVAGSPQTLKNWDSQALEGLKHASSHEKNPATGKVTQYKGVLLSQLLEKTMASLPVERRAQIDLLVLKTPTGGQVLLPRSVVVKYPVLLALDGGKASVIMPWTTRPKIMTENLPIETYFVPELSSIELSNYNDRYGGVFLKRRTDPLAMRGEKTFVQNCLNCHSESGKLSVVQLSGELQARKLASDGHPGQVKGVPPLKDRDRRALVSYLEAFRSENAAASATTVSQHN